MYTLGIDTSNYATSLAVFDTAAEEVVCDRKRFLPVKPGELGLRQSDAVFHHTAALPELLRELDAEFPLHRVDAVGVSEKPRPVEGSYMPCFLTGLAVAQGLALARGVPLVRTTHQQGHIAASLLSAAGVIAFRTARACVPYFGRNHRAPFVQRNVCRVPGGRQHRPLCRPGGGPHRRKTGLCVPGRGGAFHPRF